MPIFLLLFLLCVGVEIWSIVLVSRHLGGWAAIVLLIAGVYAGIQLMRQQGLRSIMQRMQNPVVGESPLAPIAEALVKVIAGLLFIVPGFVSDVVALLLLLPFIRFRVARRLGAKNQFQAFTMGGFGQGGVGGFGKGGFHAGGFGQSANDASPSGNVYEHEGSPTPTKSAEVIELKPKDSPQRPS